MVDLLNDNKMDSSAKDQLTGSSVAIKKIMKPFSTPVLSKRTYRELKLLKHIQHENVSAAPTDFPYTGSSSRNIPYFVVIGSWTPTWYEPT